MSPSTDDAGRARGSTPFVATGWVIAGAMMLSTSMVRWVSSGPGSTFGGLELADNLRNGALSPDWGGWVALIFYSIVGIGGVLIATAAIERPSLVIARGVLCVGGLLAFALLGGVVLPIDKWAAGPTIASTSFLVSTALSAYQLTTSSRN